MGTVRLLGVAGGVGAGGQGTVVGDPEVSKMVVCASAAATAIVIAVRPRVFAAVALRYLVVA